MFHYTQFSGVQNRTRSISIFQLYKHKTTKETIRVLPVMRTMMQRQQPIIQQQRQIIQQQYQQPQFSFEYLH